MYSSIANTVASPLKNKWAEVTVPKFREHPVDHLSARWTRARIGSRILRFFTCVSDELLEEIEQEASLRDQIRVCMTEHSSGNGKAGITEAVHQTFVDTGYDLASMNDKMVLLKMERHTFQEWEEIFALQQMDALTLENHITHTEVRVVPRFAAACVITLRAKFGNLCNNDANVLLIQREYLRACREGGVRNCDTVSHQQYVMNAYFSEGILEHIGTVRTRAPSWLRAAFGVTAKAAPTVC